MIELIKSDCIEAMKKLNQGSIHCVISSPPYYGLRDYGEGQLGNEPSPEEYVDKIVEVFREVRRILRGDGTVWLNLGDSYARVGGRCGQNNGFLHLKGKGIQKRMSKLPHGSNLKEKDLLGIPWMVAFALRGDGWWLRQDIIWHKPNPMPESVTDRCTQAHEYIFLLSASKKYYCDMQSIREPAVGAKGNRKLFRGGETYTGNNTIRRGMHREENRVCGNTGKPGTRNKHDVWTVSNPGFNGTHFSTFPENLIEPCVIAGCPPLGIVLDPFAGTGTVGVVAHRHNRHAILIDINGGFERVRELAYDNR